MEHHKNENIGEVVAVAVFARCAAHHLENVDALHKEISDKCFHEDLTRGEKLSYKKSHPSGWLLKVFLFCELLHKHLNGGAHVAAVRSVYAVGELHAQTNFAHRKGHSI